MSTLLEQASLVMIPSGYKEDVVYSQIPTSGAGDLSFTRASNGTRVNSAGLVEVVPWNLLQYSEDLSNGYWQKNNVTINSNTTVAPNGTTTADRLQISNSARGVVLLIDSTTAGTTLTFSLYAKSNGQNLLRLFCDQTCVYFQLGTIVTLTNEWVRYSLTVTATQTGAVVFGFDNVSDSTTTCGGTNGTTDCFIWGAQLNIGSTAKPYFPTTDRLNVPRLTYQNGGGGCPSLLLEKQSTNLAFPSENLTAWTAGGMTNTADITTSPDGTQNADKSTIGSTTRYYDVVTNLITTVNGTIYTTSFFAKKGTGIEAIYFYQGNGGRIAKWNLNNGVYIGYAPADGYSAFTSQTSENLGNGWYRFTATYTATSTAGNLTIGVSTNTNDSVTPISGNGTDFVYVWGLQYEASSYPTSYISTTSSSATRVADACFKTGISSLIGQSQGTLFADFVFSRATDEYAYFSIQNASALSRVRVTYTRSSNTMQIDLIIAGAASIIYTFNPSDSQRYKIAVGYKSGDSVAYINGSQVGTQAATFTYTDLSSLNYDNPAASGTQPMTGKHNQTILFPTRLSNSELASLTTI